MFRGPSLLLSRFQASRGSLSSFSSPFSLSRPFGLQTTVHFSSVFRNNTLIATPLQARIGSATLLRLPRLSFSDLEKISEVAHKTSSDDSKEKEPKRVWRGTKQEQTREILDSWYYRLFTQIYIWGLALMFLYVLVFFYHFLYSGKYGHKRKQIYKICEKIKNLQKTNASFESIIAQYELLAPHLIHNPEVGPIPVLETELLKDESIRRVLTSPHVEHRRILSLILTLCCLGENESLKGFVEQDGVELLLTALQDHDQIIEYHTLFSLYCLADSQVKENVIPKLKNEEVVRLTECLGDWSPLSVAASRYLLMLINNEKNNSLHEALGSICRAYGFNSTVEIQELNISVADSEGKDDAFVKTAVALWYTMHNRFSARCYDLLYSVIAEETNNKLAQFSLGLYWFRRGHFSESLIWMEKLIEQDPDYWPVLCFLYHVKQRLLHYYWAPVHKWFDAVNSYLNKNRSTFDEKAHDISTYQNFLFLWNQPNTLPPEEQEKEEKHLLSEDRPKNELGAYAAQLSRAEFEKQNQKKSQKTVQNHPSNKNPPPQMKPQDKTE